jgi:hypothetical protein
MKRGIFVALGILLVGVAAGVLAFCLFHPRQPTAKWMQKEFSLSDDQAQRVQTIHQDYAKICMQMCARIEQSDEHLVELLRKSDHVTPEIRAALAETDRVRTDCRTNMLDHFYQVAAVMSPGERERYLQMVFPLVEHPEEMAANHNSPRGR